MANLPELVIFDCDGVLVDSEPLANAILLADLAKRGLHLTMDDSHRLFVGGTISGAGKVAKEMGADIPEDWAARFYETLYTELEKGVPLINGVDLIDALEAKGVQTAIVSNGNERKMKITLGPHGLWERFQGRIFSAHTHGVAKPDPGLIRIALEQFGVSPGRAVLIDDSPSGCKTGIAAGVTTIGYAEETDPARLQDVSDHIVATMGAIWDVI